MGVSTRDYGWIPTYEVVECFCDVREALLTAQRASHGVPGHIYLYLLFYI